MGAIMSLNRSSSWTRGSEPVEVSQTEACKRQRLLLTSYEGNLRLIPSLPDEISIQILARLPRIYYLKMKSVSRAWKAAILSPELFSVRKELGTTEEWLYILIKADDNNIFWYALDPLSRQWQRLPKMPSVAFEEEPKKGLASIQLWNIVGSSIRIADAMRGWFGRKDALDLMPFCGCAVGAVDGRLYVLGGFSKTSARSCVWQYDPILNSWSEVNPMSIGRAYCKTAILNNKLYAVGGVTKGRNGLTPLQSAEVFDPQTGVWSRITSMPFLKAQLLPTASLADLFKPIATGMASYRGRLFVAQSLYCWPFFLDIGGEVYDPEINSWVAMPAGMGEGWPAKQAGTKLSATVEGELYALDPSSSLESARIKVYDHQDDTWKVVVGDVPICSLTDSESPYLLAGLIGKLHVITKDANRRIAVLQVSLQNHLASFPLSPSSSIGKSFHEDAQLVAGSGTNLWGVIAIKDVGSAELISCQTLAV